jgi:hypothetical protein
VGAAPPTVSTMRSSLVLESGRLAVANDAEARRQGGFARGVTVDGDDSLRRGLRRAWT